MTLSQWISDARKLCEQPLYAQDKLTGASILLQQPSRESQALSRALDMLEVMQKENELQGKYIVQLERSIQLAKDDYYDKDADGELWQHPMMSALMSVMVANGYGAMSKDFQICLVKTAIAQCEQIAGRG